jgi:drug/metabolite transporter (DMT)-like permease
MNLSGVLLSLTTGFFWALSPFCFENASRKIGSFRVAFLRVVIAAVWLFALLGGRGLLAIGARPAMPEMNQILLMILSGALGTGFGDLLSYEAYVLIGAQKTTLVLSLAPVASVIGAWCCMRESLSWKTLLGIVLVVAGVCLASLTKRDSSATAQSRSVGGYWKAALGAVFVGLGAVFSRQAFLVDSRHFEPISATAIRLIGGALFFAVAALFRRSSGRELFSSIDANVWKPLLLGTLAGPFLGMLCYISALSNAPSGIVSALAATSPIFTLGIESVRVRAYPSVTMVISTLIAVVGVCVIVL